MSVILGIDPGSRVTGYGLISIDGHKLAYIDCGCIRVKIDEDTPLSSRLKQIFEGISHIITQYRPDEVAIEQVFLSKNADSALKLGQARGSAMVAAAMLGYDVYEYSARQVKQAVVGTGAADKSQVQHMITALLRLNKSPQSDAADALAIAICHSHMNQGLAAIVGAKKIRRKRVR